MSSSAVLGLRGRSFLRELDFTPDEWESLIDLAMELKELKRLGKESPRLRGKNIALLFEKTSTRTRCAFEVAIHDQGGHCTNLDPNVCQFGHKESVADTAAVLGRYYDAIEFRGHSQASIEELAAKAGVPVYNGLTDEWHPTQALADQLTMHEHTQHRDLERISFAFLGDIGNNVANSLLVSGAMMGMDVRLVGPDARAPRPEILAEAERIAQETGAHIKVTSSIPEGVGGVDFVYTDVWVSLGEPTELWGERIEQLAPYRVDSALMAATGNDEVKFLHCLPALHDRSTDLGAEVFERFGLDGVEVSDEVFSSDASLVFDQAENRLHTIKAVVVATLT